MRHFFQHIHPEEAWKIKHGVNNWLSYKRHFAWALWIKIIQKKLLLVNGRFKAKHIPPCWCSFCNNNWVLFPTNVNFQKNYRPAILKDRLMLAQQPVWLTQQFGCLRTPPPPTYTHTLNAQGMTKACMSPSLTVYIRDPKWGLIQIHSHPWCVARRRGSYRRGAPQRCCRCHQCWWMGCRPQRSACRRCHQGRTWGHALLCQCSPPGQKQSPSSAQ